MENEEEQGENVPLTKTEIEEKLIQYVFSHPSLYTKQSRSYKDQMIAENCYQEFAATVNMNSGEAKSLWKSLRQQHTAYLKKLTTQTGQKRGREPTFRHSKIMAFLCDHKTKSKSSSTYKLKKGETKSNSENTQTNDDLTANESDEIWMGFPRHPTPDHMSENSDDTEPNPLRTKGDDSTSSQISRVGMSQPSTSNNVKPGAALLAQEADSRKRKRMTVDEVDIKLVDTLENAINSTKQNQDESFYFVMSLLPAMRRISSTSLYKYAKLKLDIQSVLLQAEVNEESGVQATTTTTTTN